jgi:hypothetical protein
MGLNANRRGETNRRLRVSTIDESFMWNSFMMSELVKFRNRLPVDEMDALDKGGFLTTVIRGFAGTASLRVDKRTALLTIISRQSCRRAGTRYNARGIDDDGNVANFVETETILRMSDGVCFGYTQLRGSVPVFWEQDANLLSAKLNITRSLEATQPAFIRHFEALMSRFGSVHVVNLLADKSGEAELSHRYEQHFQGNPNLRTNLGYTAFDFHAEVAHGGGYGAAGRILPRVQEPMIDFGFYSYNPSAGQDETEQIGVFRTNCLDCLDRTNMIQQLFSRDALELFLEYHDMYANNELWAAHNTLWADNGDQLSQIYAGTNALKTSFTRSGRNGIAGALADVTKSVGRFYINNFVDKGRQNTMDVLLGRAGGQLKVILHDPINDYVDAEVHRRKREYSSVREIKIFAGTFNLNGKTADVDLSCWLFPDNPDKDSLPDIFLIGFQELVELTPGQILNADSSRKDFWERQVSQWLNTRDSYVLLRSGQLVGTALMVFVKQTEVPLVKGVEGATKKTGMGGMAGNKGGVAVSFHFANTSFCFITAHLAAGTTNVEERHQDYKTLSSGLQFSRGRKIKDHDTVIWLGDFNYRVDLPNEAVRALIEKQEIGSIFERDQLNLQMVKGETFPYYNEMQIKFLPTYKFDNGTDMYDTSEKARIPSWTDRILSRGTNLRQLSYHSAPLFFSDHRPVYATFRAQVVIIDDKAKEQLSASLYEKRRAEVGDSNYLVNLIDLNETMLAHGLHLPSSDTRKWWIAGGQSVKANVTPPGPNYVINPDKAANPFTKPALQQPDFVVKPPLPPRPNEEVTTKKKPAVPRKPLHLSNGENTTVLKPDSLSPGTPPALPPRQNTSSSTGSISGATSGQSIHQQTGSPNPPPVPPPRSRADTGSTVSSHNSLLDMHGQQPEMSWAPLQPQSQ